MPYTIVYNDAGYIEMVSEGSLTSETASAGILEMISLAKRYNCCHYLGDFRNVTLNLTMAAICEIPVQVFNVSRQFGMHASKLKRALIVDQKNYEKFKFFETVSRNRVQTVKIFTDGGNAMDWLMGN